MQKPTDINPTFLAIWSLLKEGDQNGLEQLYRLYLDDMYRFGFSICPDEDLVKDAIQEVFLDIWHYRENLVCPENGKFYLLRSLSNRIKRELGKKSKMVVGVLENFRISDLVESSFEDQLIGMENYKFDLNKLTRAFEKLSLKQREIIHLIFFENLSYQEVAKIMEINLRSTYTLAWKALSALKKEFVLIILFLENLPIFLR